MFWRDIKPYVNSRKSVENNGITLKEGDKIIGNLQEVAERLNDFFTSCSKSTKEQNQNNQPADLSHISNSLTNRPNVSLSNTKTIRGLLEPKKATGCDGIPRRAHKESTGVLCYPLSTLLDHVLISAEIPQAVETWRGDPNS